MREKDRVGETVNKTAKETEQKKHREKRINFHISVFLRTEALMIIYSITH